MAALDFGRVTTLVDRSLPGRHFTGEEKPWSTADAADETAVAASLTEMPSKPILLIYKISFKGCEGPRGGGLR
jgi:hypothetical protein